MYKAVEERADKNKCEEVIAKALIGCKNVSQNDMEGSEKCSDTVDLWTLEANADAGMADMIAQDTKVALPNVLERWRTAIGT